MQWLQRKITRLPIFVQDPQIFWSNEGAKIVWNPTAVLSIPKEEELQELQKLLENQEQEELLERTKEEVEQIRLVCCATPPTKKKLQKETGSRRTRIYRRALRRDNLSTPQEQSFSYPQWGRTVNNKQKTRKCLFGVRFCKKKSRKRVAWEHRRASVLQTSAREDHKKQKKVKLHRVAVCCRSRMWPSVSKAMSSKLLCMEIPSHKTTKGDGFQKPNNNPNHLEEAIGCIGGRNNFVGIFSLL